MLKSILISLLSVTWLSSAVIAADEEGLVTYQAMSPDLAVQAAQAALKACRDKGYQVTVAVVDRGGNVQALIRDRFAGAHTPDTAAGKAWTAVSFRTNTSDLVKSMESGTLPAGLRNVKGAMMLGGGIKVEAAGSIVGGIGVSGAPGGEADDQCANAGLEAISEALDF